MIFLIFVFIFVDFLVFVGFLKVLDVVLGKFSFSLDSGLVIIITHRLNLNVLF